MPSRMPARIRASLCFLAVFVAGLVFTSGNAPAEVSPDGRDYRVITFPVAGKVTYTDDFGACRDGCTRRHQGNDLMGAKLTPLVATTDAHVTFLRTDASGSSGNMAELTDADGWEYWYIHVNNDTPGTDDGLNPPEYRFAPRIVLGARVTAGQTIGWMGDSGNAEGSSPHLHFELHRPDGTAVSPYTSLRLAQGLPAGGLCAYPSNPAPTPDAATNKGYWTVDANGSVYAFGRAPYLGGLNRPAGAVPVVDLAPTASGNGYWLVDAAGGVFSFGDATSFGAMSGTRLNAPMIGIAPTGTGRGYWLLARDGGIFSFGDAAFYGSMGGTRLNAPVIAMASTPSGRGYWLLGGDGGIFSFGDAEFHGSTGGFRLAAPVVGMAATGSGAGYWLLGGDGGVFAFGDAPYVGSVPGTGSCNRPGAKSLTGTKTGRGYWVLTGDARVMAFGDAVQYGDPKTYGGAPITLTAY
jgi:Peptidase family M23